MPLFYLFFIFIMKPFNTYVYDNINCDFTFGNVCSFITKFWTSNRNVFNYRKIWLSISVVNTNNRSIKLIDNLPFNTSDFTDVIIVLRQIFESKILLNRNDQLNQIIFKFGFEKEVSRCEIILRRIKKIFFYTFTFIAFIFITLLILNIYNYIVIIDLLSDLNINLAENSFNDNCIENLIKLSDKNDDNCEETNKEKKFCIFSLFINLFNGSISYYPSHFAPNLNRVEIIDFNLLEYIIYNQYAILDHHTLFSKEYIESMTEILLRYQEITNTCLGILT
jgi:hypothetical protein